MGVFLFHPLELLRIGYSQIFVGQIPHQVGKYVGCRPQIWAGKDA